MSLGQPLSPRLDNERDINVAASVSLSRPTAPAVVHEDQLQPPRLALGAETHGLCKDQELMPANRRVSGKPPDTPVRLMQAAHQRRFRTANAWTIAMLQIDQYQKRPLMGTTSTGACSGTQRQAHWSDTASHVLMASGTSALPLLQKGSHPPGEIIERACNSWLKNTEVTDLLVNHRQYGLHVSLEPPVRPPGVTSAWAPGPCLSTGSGLGSRRCSRLPSSVACTPHPAQQVCSCSATHVALPCMHAGLGERLLRTPSSAKSLGDGRGSPASARFRNAKPEHVSPAPLRAAGRSCFGSVLK